jgi:hypothetical protein
MRQSVVDQTTALPTSKRSHTRDRDFLGGRVTVPTETIRGKSRSSLLTLRDKHERGVNLHYHGMCS